MAAPQQDWSDFNFFIGDYIPRQTIPILRKFANTIEIRTRVSVGIRAGDKKADIVEKVVSAFRILKNKNDLESYASIRQICEADGAPQHRYTNYTNVPPPPAPTFGGVPNRASASNGTSAAGYGNGAYGAASGYRPQPAAGPSRNGWQTQPNTTTAYNSHWKPNPMWKPVRALTNMEALPDIAPSESSHTRRERKLHVTLPNDIIEKLNYTKSHPQASPQHSIRIFCTSSDNYRAPNTPFTPSNSLITNKAIPIEYPNNPDVYVDDYGLQFKERGLRGKPGSAPPFDLEKGGRGLPKVAGRMTSVTMGHTGPTTGKKKDVSKKFYFQIVYCEITTATELQNRIDRLNPAGPQESLNLLRKRQDADDDIEYGQSKLSLRDSLSYTRLIRPVRSTKCTHLQCFEPKWWIATNEKHPQWLCPLCNRELRFDELIVDGYTLEILNTVPDSYDEVFVEGDNQWHTEDNKYGSAAWLAQHAANGNAVVEEKPRTTPNDEEQDRKGSEFRVSTSPDPKGKRKAIEILSSDDEDEQPLSKANSRPPPPIRNESLLSAAPSTSRPPSTRPQSAAPAAVIDLTLSDSDDSDNDLNDTDPMDFDRPNDRRAQGAGSLSVPPPKPHMQEPTSVRSPLAPLPHSPLNPIQRPMALGFGQFALGGPSDTRTASTSSIGSHHRDSPGLAASWADPTLPYDSFDNLRDRTSYPTSNSHDRGPSGGSSDPRLHASTSAASRPTYSSGPPAFSQAHERRTDTWRPEPDRYARDRDPDSAERASNWPNPAPSASAPAPAKRNATPTADQALGQLLDQQPREPDPSPTSTLDDLFADEAPSATRKADQPRGASLEDLFCDDIEAEQHLSRPPTVPAPAASTNSRRIAVVKRPQLSETNGRGNGKELPAGRRARLSRNPTGSPPLDLLNSESSPPPANSRRSVPGAHVPELHITSREVDSGGGQSGASTPTTTASTGGVRKIKLNMRPQQKSSRKDRASSTDWDAEMADLRKEQDLTAATQRRQMLASLRARRRQRDEEEVGRSRRQNSSADRPEGPARSARSRATNRPNYNVDDETESDEGLSVRVPYSASSGSWSQPRSRPRPQTARLSDLFDDDDGQPAAASATSTSRSGRPRPARYNFDDDDEDEEEDLDYNDDDDDNEFEDGPPNSARAAGRTARTRRTDDDEPRLPRSNDDDQLVDESI